MKREVKDRSVMVVSAFVSRAVAKGRWAPLRPALVALALGLGGCGSGVSTPADTVVGQFFRASTEEPKTIDPELLRAETVCPNVRIQDGTESVRREDTSGDADSLSWQASITKTARECKKVETGTAVRVGVAGRVVEGPKGAPDAIELPLRIAVREGTEVTYSRLHAVSVARSGPSQDWAFVDETIVVDDPARAEIIVGFDG
ncbi:MAG: hypothetical protein AAGB11_08080 [Pseudomonadota bacterium]